ncbi:MAG: lipoyl(octanoyl) transferase LipB [Rhodospirillales bacterium]
MSLIPWVDADATGVVWLRSEQPVDYPGAVRLMEQRVAAIRGGAAPETVWLLEHPPLYTAGTSAGRGELLQPDRFPVFESGRGGRYTYHGPGQRVAYVMLDVRARGGDIRAFVSALEGWIISTLACFGIEAERRTGRVGVWVRQRDGGDAKIAALGVRLRRWVSYHGIAINVDPDLSHFGGIVACGLADARVTSLAREGVTVSLSDVDAALRATFAASFPAPQPGMIATSTNLALENGGRHSLGRSDGTN